MPESLEGQVALVTGGGSGIGANIARGLAGAGMDVWVTGRTAARVEDVAAHLGGHALAGDVSHGDHVGRWFEQALPVDLLVNDAGVQGPDRELRPGGAGVVVAGVRDQRPGRLFLLPRRGFANARTWRRCASSTSRAAPRTCRRAGSRARRMALKRPRCTASQKCSPPSSPLRGVFVSSISPGLVGTAMTESHWGDDAPWTPPESAPRIVEALASGEFDALAGRYLHAEHDSPEVLRGRIEEIQASDLNVIRLRR